MENIILFQNNLNLDILTIYQHHKNLNNIYQVGDKIKVLIKQIDSDKEILKVSHKETKEDPFAEFGERIAITDNVLD